jgi:hypothetical protein
MSTTGQVATILMCVTSDGSSSGSSSICPAGFMVGTQQAYVLSADSQPYFDRLSQPFSQEAGAGIFALAFGTVLFAYQISKYIGSIVDMVKRAIP